jgi:hypothetical protein
MKQIFLALLFCLPLVINAQKKIGNLTIFSEDGEKFYLILNGEKQNDVAQTNIRVEELPQPYYSAKIIFKDSTLAPILKNNLMIADVDGTFMDVTYKLRKDKSGKMKLNYFSMAPVQEDYLPPAGLIVYHYGNPQPATSRTVTTTNTGMGANVNVNGINIGVSVTEPVTTQTTTTTTTTSSSSSSSSSINTLPPTRGGCNGWPMNTGQFASAKKTIEEASFEESKLSTAKAVAKSNCLSTDQVIAICNLFGFEESKLAFAKYAYKYTVDQKSYFKVNTVFNFDASKEELNKFLGSEE